MKPNVIFRNRKHQQENIKALVKAREATLHIKKAIFRIETARKAVQLISFVLFSATVFGLGPWSIVLPVVHSLGTPEKTIGDAFTVLQKMLYEAVFPWLPLASFLLIAIVLGRSLCGWVCPFGFVQDLLTYVKKKHTQVSLRTHQSMINVKYFILAATLLVSGTLAASLAMGMGESYKRAIGIFAPAPFNALSPSDTLFAVLPRIVLNALYGIAVESLLTSPLFWARLFILGAFVLLVAYVPRGWCRYACPHGALMAILNRFSFLGLKRDPVRCTKDGCRKCVEVCPMKIRILELPWEKFADPECIYCLKCVDECPTKAIKPKFP
ncbi:MAG: 4Fe-4S binding protein [Candidatus Bathyarchaeota archaeon]|nr:4Fe-4S binding protein [Candidatus Bathyarchaeota archaeon]